MKKPLIILLLCLWWSINSYAQYGTSKSCQVNAKDWHNSASSRNNIVRSVVRLNSIGCTGTLLNRKTSDNDVRHYILMARHCLSGVNLAGNNVVTFNFQSRDGNNANTADPSNRGAFWNQSTNYNSQAFEYLHETSFREVASYNWGDFCLLEMLTPPPAHFNYYYAGWTPREIPSIGLPLSGTKYPYVNIHHPSMDIKKISGTPALAVLQTPIATGCITVTKIIDVLIGWIWKRKISTQVICNYVDNPWLMATWVEGVPEGGSSGSAIFDPWNQVIATCSGLPISGCVVKGPDTYGKFKNNYYNWKVKSTLNPGNDWWVDQWGMSGRQVSCYPDLSLTGTYFPAAHYQPDNPISLNAQNTINTTGTLTILGTSPHLGFGPDYQFNAGNGVTLNPGFLVQQGANFQVSIQGCSQNKEPDPVVEYAKERITSIQLPSRLEFNIEDHLAPDQKQAYTKAGQIELYPNPTANGVSELSMNFFKEVKALHVIVSDIYGRQVFSYKAENVSGDVVQIPLMSEAPGIYTITIAADNQRYARKLIKQ